MEKFKDIELANLVLDVYRIIGFHVATRFESAICNYANGQIEAEEFYQDASDDDVRDLAIYLSVLREMNGFKYANDLCKGLNGVKKFKLLSEHLCLSVYS